MEVSGVEASDFGDAVEAVLEGVFVKIQSAAYGGERHIFFVIDLQNFQVFLLHCGHCAGEVFPPRLLIRSGQKKFQIQIVKYDKG